MIKPSHFESTKRKRSVNDTSQPAGIYGSVDPSHIKIVLRIQLALSRDLLPADLMFALSPDCHFTRGHCAVATEAAFHLFGKQAGYKSYVCKDTSHGGTNTHWWLFHPVTKAIVDPTAEQINGDPKDIYECGHHQTLRTKLPSKRAAEVIRRVQLQSVYSKKKFPKL